MKPTLKTFSITIVVSSLKYFRSLVIKTSKFSQQQRYCLFLYLHVHKKQANVHMKGIKNVIKKNALPQGLVIKQNALIIKSVIKKVKNVKLSVLQQQ